MLKTIFQKVQPDQVIKEQLHEAEIQALQHEAALEHHAAMAQMYRDRITRLNGFKTSGVGTTKSS